MSCPTCTDHARCVVDRRCSNKMKLDKCNWSKYASDMPFATRDASGRLVVPYLTNYVKGVHDKQIEGFGFAGMSQTNTMLVLILLLLLVFYVYNERK